MWCFRLLRRYRMGYKISIKLFAWALPSCLFIIDEANSGQYGEKLGRGCITRKESEVAGPEFCKRPWKQIRHVIGSILLLLQCEISS